MLELTCVLCDVFTDRALTGNQLAVFRDGAAVPELLRQPLAREIGFSETVFCEPDEDADARVRIFTPARELEFAGHPVLGTAVTLADGAERSVRLRTGAGILDVAVQAPADHVTTGRMRQPLPTWEPVADAERLLGALGVERTCAPVEVYDNGVRHAFVVLDDPASVEALTPDVRAIGRGWPGMGVSSVAGADTEWTTRMFGPGLGVDEDPATGSAAGPLAVHLARHGLTQYGEELTISQGAALDRPSTLRARAVTDAAGQLTAVEVAGGVAIVGTATFRLPAGLEPSR